ncbi:hypothetical protein EXIGLDRAFT_836259 [Exidia glandulosa HHB12029]|uniref:F-box domain-containing protein n=1 Tax=Exidia glandulosa HHB12029 TaxID=1314781 RepID=A0A165HYK8_EXIGL|nr:hypothetical protein EXIGLDRAFT_836259 [Exidia glandulosa HHB12029]
MSHLQHLRLDTFIRIFKDDMDDLIRALRGLDELNYIQCVRLPTSTDVALLLDALPPLKRISFSACSLSGSLLGRLLLRSIDTLEYLAADGYYALADCFVLSDVQGRVWPRMRELEVGTSVHLAVIRAFPGLTRLSMASDPAYPADILWDQSLMRNVEQLYYCMSGIPDVTRRGDAQRVVPHLCLNIALDPEADDPSNDFYAVMRCFSLRSLRSLCLEAWSSSAAFSAVLGTLPTLLEGCLSLCYFGLRGDEQQKVDPYHIISSILSSTSKARRLKFVNLDVKAIWTYSDSATDILVRAHLTRVIPASFADNENLHVLQIADPGTAAYSWKRQQSVRGGEVGEAVAFATVHDTSGLPWSLSDIAVLIDAYDT